MTLWWANKLKAKNALVRGQVLRIPPVSGLVVEVKATDTLASLASRYKVGADEILATNKLEDRNLVVGQVLVLPDAKGAPIVAPKPPKKATVRSSGVQLQRQLRRHARACPEDLLRRQLRLADLEPPHQPVLPLRPLRASTSTARRATRSTPRRRGR